MKQFVLLVTVLLLVILVWSQLDTPEITTPTARIISVEGNGEVEVVPDIIRLHFNITAFHDSDVAVAKADVDQRASAAAQALIKLGVKEADISSSSFQVNIVEDYRRSEPRTREQRVSRAVEVVLRDTTRYNAALQVLVDSGISEITHIQPDVSNYDALKQQALASAAEDARKQAEFLADQFDARLSRVHKIGRQNIQRHFGLEEVIATSAKQDMAAPQAPPHEFKPGKVKVTSHVYAEFELEN
ncbi:SIMPL domain-containing protein [Litorivivens sp.]|uniref:SIMPL domain-containing protein n=1 Tax=Litorivivens sp. TaxID=2020868 RepID=UPI003562BCA3